MKIAILTFLFSLFFSFSFANQISGRISQMRPGAYRIMYPQQIIKVYFDYAPTNGLENVFSESDLSENERSEITNLIKEQIDQWPEDFVNNFMDVEIYPLAINNDDEFYFFCIVFCSGLLSNRIARSRHSTCRAVNHYLYSMHMF